MKNIPRELQNKHSYVIKRFLLTRELALKGSPKNILDVGCSDGLFLSLFNDNIEKYGVDLIEPHNEQKNINYKKHDISIGFPYENSTFDVVTSSEVIEHIADTVFFLKECFRVLKPGGRVVISTPNLHYWRNAIEWLKGNQFFYVDYHNEQEGHVRYFCPKTMRELTSNVGFTNIHIRTVGDWGGKNLMLKIIALFFEKFSLNKNIILIMDAKKPNA